ncbi:hypothetical protein JCM11641_000335 [Rhodosporidiobolus odoratus]
MPSAASSTANIDYSLFAGSVEHSSHIPPSLRARSTVTSSPSPSSSSVSRSSSRSSTTNPDSDPLEPEISTAATTPGEELSEDKAWKLPGEQWAPKTIQQPQDGTDFLWQLTEEPHRSRRRAIMKAHPEVTKLMGYEPLTKYVVLLVTLIQFSTAYYLRNTDFFSWKFWILAYVIGGTANQNTFLAVHEITHNLAFRGVKANRLFAIFTNLPIGVPYAMTFKKYHIEHHKYLGEDGMDTDIPSRLELLVLRTVLGKTFFCTFQIFFYALRPGFVRYQAPTRWIVGNMITQLAFNALVVKCFGWMPMLYFLLSSHMAGSLHPCAGHFIAEHYLFDLHDQETWSYYGPLNLLAYNVGYHNEHHDFPSVPWTRLPALRRLASEYYDPLPRHESWPGVTWKFITDPKVGMWSRAKRPSRNGGIPGGDGGGGEGKYKDAGGLKDE